MKNSDVEFFKIGKVNKNPIEAELEELVISSSHEIIPQIKKVGATKSLKLLDDKSDENSGNKKILVRQLKF